MTTHSVSQRRLMWADVKSGVVHGFVGCPDRSSQVLPHLRPGARGPGSPCLPALPSTAALFLLRDPRPPWTLRGGRGRRASNRKCRPAAVRERPTEAGGNRPGGKGQAVTQSLRGPGSQTCVSAATPRWAGAPGSFTEKKRMFFGGPLLGGCWPGEAGGGLARSGVSRVTGQGSTCGFLCLLLSWNWRQKLGELTVISQVLSLWGHVSQGYC